MKSYLIAQDLWRVIEISASSASAANDLKSLNSKALSLIILSCEDHIIRLLDPNDLAANAWKKLEKQYGLVGFSARHLAFQSLVSTHISSCDIVDQFIDQFRSNINTLSQITTSTLPQWLLLSIFINNVSSQFEPWAQSIMQQVRMKSIPEDSRTYLEEIIASLIDEARRIGGAGGVGGIDTNTAMTARKPAKAKPICKYCGKIHKSENCWQEFPEKKPSARLSTTTTSTNQVNQDNQFSSYPSQSIAFLSQHQNNHHDRWILDSGATQHMCNNKSLFTHLEPYNTTITIANNTNMAAIGRGDIKLTTQNGTAFSLINVLYVPKLASNLLSVCCATKNPKMRFNFKNGECEIIYDNTILATAKQHDSLLVLETISNYAHLSKSTSSLTWHKRLGHLNNEYMSKNHLKSLIGTKTDFSCETCLKNKSTRIISRTSPNKAKRPLEKIHSDVAGPITPTSLGGSKYVVTFTDDYSRFTWVFPCSAKSQVFDIFKTFKRTVENELNQKMSLLHCDNGGEYSSNLFKRFANQEGIQIQYTVPHTPEQNGVAERLNRTLFSTTRCMLNDSPILPKSLWAELVRTACYIKNRVPTSSNEAFISPYEKLFNRPPKMDYLRIIGSCCFSHNTGKIIGKLDERSTKCYLVGYESENIFRLFDPTTGKVFRARDVTFQETIQQSSDEKETSTTVEKIEEIHHDMNMPQSTTIQDFQQPQYNSYSDPARSVEDPSHVEYSQQYHTAQSFPQDDDVDSSLDELANPKYDFQPRHARAFITTCLNAADSSTQYIPERLEQAMRCSQARQWGESMRDEMKSIVENHTWDLVPAPSHEANVIQGRWVFRTKTDANGQITKFKSRWVVRGFQQEEGCNYTDTFACVVKPMSYKILFSLAAAHNLEIEQMDVKTAFLNSPIHEDVYVEQPHGFEVTSIKEGRNLYQLIMNGTQQKAGKEDHLNQETLAYPKPKRNHVNLVCKLNKALYGLKQAPRAWYETLWAFMQKANYTPLKCDYAVFANANRSVLVAVYVDDILIFGKDKSQIQHLKSQLHQRFQMSDMGPAHMYLGMQITRDRTARTILVDQEKYIQIILKRFNMLDCNSVSTPMETNLKLIKRTDKATSDQIQEYQRIIGSLEYAAIATRPDIAFAVHKLAQFSSNPDESHFKAAKRVLRYLKGSAKFGLLFQGQDTNNLELIGYTDADWAGSIADRKSIGGYCFYLNRCLISHMSKKQRTVALSTAESETHAATEATKEAIWLRNILEELGLKQKKETTIFCDNQAAIALSHNPEYHSRSKHVDIEYQFLRHHVEIKTVILKYVRSEEMAADGLTKSLSREKHQQFCDYLHGKKLLEN